MANASKIIDDLMNEWGKSGPELAMRLEQKIGEVTVDLLSQNEGQFKGLEKTQAISIAVDQKEYLLNADFNTAQKNFYEVDDDGDPVREIFVVTKKEMFNKLLNDSSLATDLVYVKQHDTGYNGDGPGWYLILPTEPSETTTFEFTYYRFPVAGDTRLIRNETILKTGVKREFPEHNLAWQTDTLIYNKMRGGFKENPDKFKTRSVTLPNDRTQRHNRMLHKIGRGG